MSIWLAIIVGFLIYSVARNAGRADVIKLVAAIENDHIPLPPPDDELFADACVTYDDTRDDYSGEPYVKRCNDLFDACSHLRQVAHNDHFGGKHDEHCLAAYNWLRNHKWTDTKIFGHVEVGKRGMLARTSLQEGIRCKFLTRSDVEPHARKAKQKKMLERLYPPEADATPWALDPDKIDEASPSH